MNILKWIHASMVLSLIIPLFFALMFTLGFVSDETGVIAFYIKCFLIIIPVIATDIAIKHIKSLWKYIVICIGICVFMSGVVFLIAGNDNNGLSYKAIMILETVYVCIVRFINKVNQVRYIKADDPYAILRQSFIDKPALAFLWYFVAVYLSGLVLDSKSLCDISFFSAVIYLFLTLAYSFLDTTNKYLLLNKRVSGIPKKRLYAVSAGMMGIFAVILFFTILPSILLADDRNYTDIRDWFKQAKVVPYTGEYVAEINDIQNNSDIIMPFGEIEELPPQITWLLNMFFKLIGIICVSLFIYAISIIIKHTLEDFRQSVDENGDKIEEIENEKISYKEEIIEFFKGHKADSESERIKRQYRKTIRKHRKERPQPYETPTEIEIKAGLAEDSDMKILHKKYEEVRYNYGSNSSAIHLKSAPTSLLFGVAECHIQKSE